MENVSIREMAAPVADIENLRRELEQIFAATQSRRRETQEKTRRRVRGNVLGHQGEVTATMVGYCLVKKQQAKASVSRLWARQGALTDTDWRAKKAQPAVFSLCRSTACVVDMYGSGRGPSKQSPGPTR